MKKLILFSGVLALCGLLFVGCTEEKIIRYEEPTVDVTGTVYGWRCGINDGFNNSGDLRYTVNTGLPATVKMVREDNCCTFSGLTDDSSMFEIDAELGNYFAVVETPHGRPDTFFNINLTRDTVFRFDIVYDYFPWDTVFVDYFYANPDDSLGFDEEWLYVYTLDQWSQGMLDLEGVRREIEEIDFSDWVMVTYCIPVKDGYAPWMVEAKVSKYINENTVPPHFSFHTGIYFCLM